MLGASDSKTRVSLLALQPGANGKTDWGRQRDASPDSGWAIFGSGSALLHSCCLSAIGPTCICPLDCSLKRPPPHLGGPASHNGAGEGRSTWQCLAACDSSQVGTRGDSGFVQGWGRCSENGRPVQTQLSTAARQAGLGAPKPPPWVSTLQRSAKGQRKWPISPSQLMTPTSQPGPARLSSPGVAQSSCSQMTLRLFCQRFPQCSAPQGAPRGLAQPLDQLHWSLGAHPGTGIFRVLE